MVAYPAIKGCNHQHYCVLEVPPTGSLTCSVKEIRPRVQLELIKVNNESSEVIEFYDKAITTFDTEGKFDVTLTYKYRTKDPSTTRVAIECRTVGVEIDSLRLSAKFDVLFASEKSTADTTKQVSYYWIVFAVTTVAVLVIVLCGIMCTTRVGHCRGKEHTQEETEEMPMLPKKATKEKQDKFIVELKSKYQDLYNAVQPIPFMRDRMYCVKNLFVSGGIEYLANKDGAGLHGTWNTLHRYQDIWNYHQERSLRCILEGQPGYGKSTLALQLAHDWSNGCHPGSVDILIFLRLRQLSEISSIFAGIKQLLLSKDSSLTENDIKNIMYQSSSLTFILDGFDEYPDQEGDSQSDVIDIMKKNMFRQCAVILTTRSQCLPTDYPPQTKRIRLMGFDDNAREEYLKKVVAGKDREAVKKVKKMLNDNVVLAELCQVPLLFVMFAHMSHEGEQFQKIHSVTSFFRYVITSFHSHMENKMKDENVKKFELIEKEHQKLDKIAFDGLREKNRRTSWTKEKLRAKLGHDFYDQYVRIGILVEEEVLCITDKPSAPIDEHIKYKTQVRFYHRLLCEWFAAHYLADHASKEAVTFAPTDDPHITESSFENSALWNSDPFLKLLDPIDLHFLYRFACGLNPVAGKKITEYFIKCKVGKKYAVLCIFEQEGNDEEYLECVKHLCSSVLEISSENILLQQRATTQLLELASSKEIPVSKLHLNNCFQSVDMKENCLCLSSGLLLPRLNTLKELEISFTCTTDLCDRASCILDYSARCVTLKTLVFSSLLSFLIKLPQSLDDKDVLRSLYEKDCQVNWRYTIAEERHLWRLNLQTGKWESNETGKEMSKVEYQTVVRWNDHFKSSSER